MEANDNFNMQELADDISIITVTEPFDFSDAHVQPVEMFKSDDAPIEAGTTCVSTGWGLTTGGGLLPPNVLQGTWPMFSSQKEFFARAILNFRDFQRLPFRI